MIRNPHTALIAQAMMAAAESAKPAVAIVEDDPTQRRKIEDALQGEVVVVGAGPRSDWQHVIPRMKDMTTGLTFSQAAGPKHLQPRPDIEAWNRKIDEQKAAKRREKGKS